MSNVSNNQNTVKFGPILRDIARLEQELKDSESQEDRVVRRYVDEYEATDTAIFGTVVSYNTSTKDAIVDVSGVNETYPNYTYGRLYSGYTVVIANGHIVGHARMP